MNLANLITVLRFPLLLLVVGLLYSGGMAGQFIDVGLIALLILMDSLDGIVARRRHETTLVGSMLDVAADRAVEIVLWVAFAHLGLISLAIPVIFIMRGTLTDSIREVALRQGESPHSMMRGSVTRWLVASPAMRSSYAVIKALAFMTLALAAGLHNSDAAYWDDVSTFGAALAWLATVMCLVRGLPVILDAHHLFQSAEFQVPAPPVSRPVHE
ncbi:MAG: CDP-alcohol phosphatidyltransferase family protein [Chloroflexi bacterium]|nr:MAG: CDP-alcohol phosphatidyltransferase family protein [Chloroflexota bacterium]